jgi:gamma-glutamyltranspeptidase/glutathione hydrolase
LCNMCPTLGRSPDGSWFAVGACGGRKIFPSIFQLIIFLTDYGLSLEDAIHQGRIDVSGTDLVTLMDNLPLSTIEALEHTFASTRIRPNDVSPNFFALPQIITRSPKGLLEGGCFIPSPHALVASIA